VVLSCTASDIVTVTYWLKIAHFCYPSLIRRPRCLCSLWNFAVRLTMRKLVMVLWRPHDRSLSHISTQCQRVKDGQTDGRTDGRIYSSQYSALHSKLCSRAVKMVKIRVAYIYGSYRKIKTVVAFLDHPKFPTAFGPVPYWTEVNWLTGAFNRLNN